MFAGYQRIICAISIYHFVHSAASYYYNDEQLPTFLSASVGDHIVFDCDIEYPQDIVIPYILNWKKEGKTIYSWDNGITVSVDPYGGRIQLLNNSSYGKASINLTSIRESDSGWYECKIIFPFRTPTSMGNGTWFYLAVTGGNLLEIPPINQTVLEGEDVQFTCITRENGVEIRWFKDGVLLTELANILQRSHVESDGSLSIRATEMGDSGEYICEAVNYLKESQSAKAYLDVQYKAKVIYTPKELYLPYGQPAVLDCHFRANPPLKNLRWEKDGFLFDAYNVPGVFYRQNGSLYFNKVDESHKGRYSCTPYNELGTEGPSPTINVMVLRPPVFVATPHHLYLRKLGETIELVCDARDGDNEHKPLVAWYKKDGSSLPEGRYTIKDGNLTITNIHEEDKGLYQCAATNEAATITAEAELLVENSPPRSPYNLTTKSDSHSITLQWVAGRKRPRIRYSVWYRDVSTQEWRNVEIKNTHPLEAAITHLLPGREYEFMVLSEDPHGEALFSKPIRAATLNDSNRPEVLQAYSPVGPPVNIKIHSVDDGYVVSWDPPEYGSEYLAQYTLKWYEASSETLEGLVETRDTAYLVSNLEEGTSYDFEVVAVAVDEYQAASPRVAYPVPAYKKIKILTISLVVLVICIVLAVALVYYIKSKWCKRYSKSNSIKK
ncbi:hypothetical protein PPYR_07392 [Photinus pyralis]|uniref:Protein borderless n=2 Tax=Photinus pyralis TaxID=7054 RepID=A0A1Y1LJ10_PHOPY|nr:protein borderless [Photinus pyralis]KAB0799512.1 hypothetical protein PPYR_07392 [Photinus pyralis]